MVSPGVCSITASQAGNTAYNAAPDVPQTFAIGKANQTITFTNPGSQTFSPGGTVALTASSDSGLTVSFAATTASVCTVSGATVTMVSPGVCSITASQAGNTAFLPAPNVTQSVALGAPAISLGPASLPSGTGGAAFNRTLTASGGTSPYSFAVTAGSLPAGLALSSTGVLSGKATSAGTFNFTVTVTDGSGFKVTKSYSLTIGRPVIAVGPAKLPGGSQGLDYDATVSATGGSPPYTFAVNAGALPPGLSLDASTGRITGTPKGNGRFAFTVMATDAFGFTGANAYTVTIDTKYIAEHTSEVIKNFMSHRADVLTSNEPDRARNFRRLGKSLFGGDTGESGGSVSGGGAPFNLEMSGSDDGGSGRLAFATSLQQMLVASRRSKSAEGGQTGESPAQKMGLGGPTSAYATATTNPNFDFWVEGHAARFDAKEADATGDVSLIYTGADYLVMPGLLVGAILQFDFMDETSSRLGSDVSGHGWMAGPYVTARLTPNLYFDARAAWGESQNSVSPFRTYVDEFSTYRWLARADLTGNWEWSNLRLTPSVGISYFEEVQNAYLDSNGIAIPAHTSTLGRLTFGPEIGYRFKLSEGSTMEPFVSLQGLWDFDNSASPTVNGVVSGSDDLRAKVQMGASFISPSGYTLRASGAIDGLGADDFKAYSGQLWINMPLN